MLYNIMVVLKNYFYHWPTATAVYMKCIYIYWRISNNEGMLKLWKKFWFKMGRSEIKRRTFKLFFFSDFTGSLKDCQGMFRMIYKYFRFYIYIVCIISSLYFMDILQLIYSWSGLKHRPLWKILVHSKSAYHLK